MLFAFFVSLLAFSIALWIFEQLVEQSFFSKTEMTKIGTAYLAMVLVLIIFLPHTNRAIWFAVMGPLIVASAAAFLVIRNRAKQFRELIRQTLSLISLKMKSGRSFRQALGEACGESPMRFRSKLSEIANAVVFSQQTSERSVHPFITEVIEELVRVDQNPHASMKRLAVYRLKLKIEDDFRRRSGQVLSRIRAQSIVMTCLFAAVFAFMIWNFGWSANSTALLSAALLFACGGVWIYFGGRRLRWRV